jgi:hypothetical protein
LPCRRPPGRQLAPAPRPSHGDRSAASIDQARGSSAERTFVSWRPTPVPTASALRPRAFFPDHARSSSPPTPPPSEIDHRRHVTARNALKPPGCQHESAGQPGSYCEVGAVNGVGAEIQIPRSARSGSCPTGCAERCSQDRHMVPGCRVKRILATGSAATSGRSAPGDPVERGRRVIAFRLLGPPATIASESFNPHYVLSSMV